jgi:hypothetical protein
MEKGPRIGTFGESRQGNDSRLVRFRSGRPLQSAVDSLIMIQTGLFFGRRPPGALRHKV